VPAAPRARDEVAMCGIAGIVDADLPAEEIGALLGRMAGAMVHRGPDSGGQVVFADERAGLAARRLSIVDLAAGEQPMANEDGTVHVVFNGEIYNHEELRAGLRSRGHRFRSRCDTEVVVHLYEELGEACVQRLEGMFALAVYDRSRRRLLLARDGPGMKPLYLAETARGLLFASEVKALLASGLVEARPDPASLDAYLAIGYFPAPYCGFAGVEKLRAGELVVAERGRLRRERFWRYGFRTDRPPRRDEEYGEELDHLLQGAVRRHLSADVPVGALVSGGWDSSLVASFAARQTPGRLKTFSIVFPDDPRHDESRYSRLLATRLGSEHHEVEFRAALVPDLMLRAIRHLEEPIASAPALLVYLVSSLAGGHVKTVLSGEGADELFGGYHRLKGKGLAATRAGRHGGAGRIARSRWDRAAAWLRAHGGRWPLGGPLASAAAADAAADDLDRLRALTPAQKERLLRPELRVQGPDLEAVRLDPEILASCGDRVQRRTALELTSRLPECLLFQTDKASMAHSLETRLPFLDRSVVEFAQRLPSNLKIRGSQEKYVLSLLGKHLPPEIAGRRKQGLGYPRRRFRQQPVAGFIRDTLLAGARGGGPFDPAFLETHYDRWARPGQTLSRRPLLLVFLQVWWNEFFTGSSPRASAPPGGG
jgi:asparagine synthase (glutamine-hydrolysing)